MNTRSIKNFPFYFYQEIKRDFRKLLGIKTPKHPPLAMDCKASDEPLFDPMKLKKRGSAKAANLQNEVNEALHRHTHGLWTNNWVTEVEDNHEVITKGEGSVFSIQKTKDGRDLWITTNLKKECTEIYFPQEDE